MVVVMATYTVIASGLRLQRYGRVASTVNILLHDPEVVPMPCIFGVAVGCLGLVGLLVWGFPGLVLIHCKSEQYEQTVKTIYVYRGPMHDVKCSLTYLWGARLSRDFQYL